MIAKIMRAYRILPVLAMSAALMIVLAVPAFAQDASDLTGPLTAKATSAGTAAFAVAAVVLGIYLLYRVVKRVVGG